MKFLKYSLAKFKWYVSVNLVPFDNITRQVKKSKK